MSNVGTQLDRPYAQQDATRAAARRFLERTGRADLIEMLGLDDADEQPAPAEGRRPCPTCGKPLPDPIVNGGNKPCRRADCVAERKSRVAVDAETGDHRGG